MKGVNLEEELIKQFGEWGDLENVRVIHSKNIGFVRYRLRAAAEFAKEAMADSSLGNDEVMTVVRLWFLPCAISVCLFFFFF